MNFAFVQIFIDPEFEVLFVFVTPKTDTFPHFACLLIDGVDVEIEVTIFSFVSCHESDLGLDRKEKSF